MLYINTFGEELLLVPRNVAQLPEGEYRLILRNTLDRSEFDIPIIEASETLLMLLLRVDLPKIASGSYEYEIWKGNAEMSIGLITVENDNYETKEYNPLLNYEQYEE